jgi:hypothetical protein
MALLLEGRADNDWEFSAPYPKHIIYHSSKKFPTDLSF